MAEKKKQHYVPRFYMKYFSNSPSNTHIGLYNFATKKFIRDADLKHQAYENYFYGKDCTLEDKLGELEGKAEKILTTVIRTKDLPKATTEDFAIIRKFMLIQDQRTMNAAKETNEMVNTTVKTILKNHPKYKDLLDEFEIVLTEPAKLNLELTNSLFGVAKDLACKLIVNRTITPFITSNNPVVKYNQFLEKKKFPGGRTGLATKGLQIFFPVNPELTLLFYDSRVYKTGFRNQVIVETVTNADIDQINLLQSLNCDDLIFFNHSATEYYVRQLQAHRDRFYKESVGEVLEGVPLKNTDGTSTIPMQFHKNNHEVKLTLSFIRETEYAKKYHLTGYKRELRN